MSQELRPDLTRTLAGCHRIDARMWQEQWPDVARILKGRYTPTGLASQIGTDERTIRRWKQQIVYSVAIELKYL